MSKKEYTNCRSKRLHLLVYVLRARVVNVTKQVKVVNSRILSCNRNAGAALPCGHPGTELWNWIILLLFLSIFFSLKFSSVNFNIISDNKELSIPGSIDLIIFVLKSVGNQNSYNYLVVPCDDGFPPETHNYSKNLNNFPCFYC